MIRTMARRWAFAADWIVRHRGSGLILVYHRIADEPWDPYALCVTPTDFEEHLQVVRAVGRPMSLASMGRALAEGVLPPRAIGLTFDDAYLDVHETAVPLLQRHELPATVFVTVGAAGREREFWWDELERVLLEPGTLPDTLDLDIGRQRRRWQLGADAVYSAGRRESCRGWTLAVDYAPTARHAVFRDLYSLLRPLTVDARSAALDHLLSWAGDGGGVRGSRRVMGPDALATMTAHGLIEAGAHTVTHLDMPSQPVWVQRAEARQSKEELERWTDRVVDTFAYPYGRYDAGSVDAVRDAGFAFACSGDHRVLRPGDDPLVLPRVDVPPGDGDALEALIRRFLG